MKYYIKILFILLAIFPAYIQASEEHPQSIKSLEAQKIIDKTPKKNNANPEKPSNPNSTTIHKPVLENEKPSSTQAKHNETEKNKESWMHKFTNDPTAVFTAGLFVATLLLWWVTLRLVVNTQKASRRQFRAYVFACLAEGEKLFLDENECLSAPLIIKNYGQTPAYNLKCSNFIGTFPLPLSETLDPPNFINGSVGTLPPNQIFRVYPTLPSKLSDTDLKAIANGVGGVFIWGYLEYFDIFKVKHNVSFRLLSTKTDFGRSEFIYCDEGNEED